jgi:hypothetical protein
MPETTHEYFQLCFEFFFAEMFAYIDVMYIEIS